MGEKVRKFIPRADRYLLRPQDRKLMRFSLEHSVGPGGIEQTILLNLSETGVAFLMTPGVEPRLGQRIKVEIPVPGGEQIAWWGEVMRIESFEPPGWKLNSDTFHEDLNVMVAVKFDALPGGHSKTLRTGLRASFMQTMRDQQYRTWDYYQHSFIEKYGQALLYAILTALAFGFIYWFTLPDAHYNSQRGAPWGERFKF